MYKMKTMRMRRLLLMMMGLWCLSLTTVAQIAKVELDKGSDKSSVEDIVIVFKMHFDIGYTDWAESVLQKYSTTMMDRTLESLEQTAGLPKADRCAKPLMGTSHPAHPCRGQVPAHRLQSGFRIARRAHPLLVGRPRRVASAYAQLGRILRFGRDATQKLEAQDMVGHDSHA